MIEHWSQRLRKALDRKGWSQAELSRRSGVPEASIRKYHQGGVDQPRGEIVGQLAQALGVHKLWLREGTGPEMAKIPLVGHLGAGEVIIPFDEHERGAGFDEVDFSLDDADPIAIQVRGTSMVPAYRPGDILMCSRRRGFDMLNCVGRDCAVLLENGEGYVKRIAKGDEAGTFNLVSYNAELIPNARLQWCAPVVWVKRAH